MPLKSLKCFIVDSFPVQTCKNIRIGRSKLVQGKSYRGFNASKREYYYGCKTSMITCENGLPIDIKLAPASYHDLTILKNTPLDLIPKGTILVGDAAYLSESFKGTVAKQGIELITDKRRNSKKGLLIREWHILKRVRKMIETSISSITALMPRAIKAVTSRGFRIKVLGFVLAFAFSKISI